MEPSPRRGRRTAISTDLASLQAQVAELVAAGKTLQPSTVDRYRREWNRFRAWCEASESVPDRAFALVEPEFVFAWLVHEYDGKAAKTVRGAIQGVSWGRQRIDLPPISTAAGSRGGQVVAQLGRRRRTRRTGARPATADTWAAVLTVPPPPVPVDVMRRRAALALAYAAGSPMGARATVATLTSADLQLGSKEITFSIGGIETAVPAGAGADAVRELANGCGSGPLLGSNATALLSATHRAATATMRHLRFGAGGRLADPFDQQVDADGLARLLLHQDMPGCRWLHDQVVLSCQVFGGWRPSDLVRLQVTDVRFSRQRLAEDDGKVAVVTLARSKGDPAGFGHTRSLPAWPGRPELCPVALLLSWIWLLNLPPSAPLLPSGTPKSIYRRTHQATPLNAARKRFEGPLGRRLEQLGLDSEGLAGTTGRHTLGTVAAGAGLDRFAIADHLGQRSLSSTEHYIAAASQADAAHAMAGLLTDDLPEHHR